MSRQSILRLVICVVFALSGVACRQEPDIVLQNTAKTNATLTSVVYTGDPDSARQLVDGFFQIEEFSWRWTAQRFSVVLRAPDGAAGETATLAVALAVPQAEIDKLGRITLTAAVGADSLKPETFVKAGSYTYTRDIPAGLLKTEHVRIDFSLDKAMKTGGNDLRELGVIVKSIGLEPR